MTTIKYDKLMKLAEYGWYSDSQLSKILGTCHGWAAYGAREYGLKYRETDKGSGSGYKRRQYMGKHVIDYALAHHDVVEKTNITATVEEPTKPAFNKNKLVTQAVKVGEAACAANLVRSKLDACMTDLIMLADALKNGHTPSMLKDLLKCAVETDKEVARTIGLMHRNIEVLAEVF